ncbi:MAG: PAS domain S-box protein [Clostridiaceae bacterium]|nr:PAS domain S-box protein [Clostridiaceae bacterium]
MALTKTGIDIIEYVPWGTHMCQFYSSKSDLFEGMAPYIKEGLESNELCVCFYSHEVTCQEIYESIKKNSLNDVETYIDKGQLRLISHTEWYEKDSSFDKFHVNEKWAQLLKHALDNGFEGLRAVVDTSWLVKHYSRDFFNYERNINSLISKMPFIVLCLYDVNTLNIIELTEVISNHDYIIVKDKGRLRVLKNIELLVKNKQLEQGKEDYEKLLRLLPDAVFIHNRQRILYCNEAAARIVGMEDQDSLLGKPITDLIADDNKSHYEDFIEQILEHKETNGFTKSRLVYKGGEYKDIEVVATNYVYKGFPAVLSVIREALPFNKTDETGGDVKSNIELLKETLECERMKTEFFVNISHELRTPINIILAALTLIDMANKDMSHDSRVEKYFKMMRQNCYRLLRLINNVIDISKIDSQFFELNLKNCDIVKIVEDTTLSIADYTKQKGIQLQFDTNTEEKIIACDPDQMERIILNLLSNAVKFTPEGGNIWVDIVDLGETITIIVKDNGIGIPQHKQEIIFNRFQQLDKSFNRRCVGSGIGLFLVKSLVEKHGGKITLKSEVGRGSEFILEIPCRTIPQPEYELEEVDHSGRENYIERAVIEFSDIYM